MCLFSPLPTADKEWCLSFAVSSVLSFFALWLTANIMQIVQVFFYYYFKLTFQIRLFISSKLVKMSLNPNRGHMGTNGSITKVSSEGFPKNAH